MTDRDLVAYAGRSTVDAPQDRFRVLTDRDVVPHALRRALDGASMLVILDPMSFPFESLRGRDRDIPVVLALPDLDVEAIDTLLGEVVLRHLTFFDRIAVLDEVTWDELRSRYRWAHGQRLRADMTQPEKVIEGALDLADTDEQWSSPVLPDEDSALDYWRERGRAQAQSWHRAIGSVHHGLRRNKAMHLVQAAALQPRLEDSRRQWPGDMRIRALELGSGVGRWSGALHWRDTMMTGVDVSEELIGVARQNYPECRHLVLEDGLDLPFEKESFNLAMSVTVLHHNPLPARKHLVRELFRVTRPGGQLVLLEDFVASAGPAATVYPQSLSSFLEMADDATNGRLAVEHVEALRYPHDDFHRAGLVVLTRLGVPRR